MVQLPFIKEKLSKKHFLALGLDQTLIHFQTVL